MNLSPQDVEQVKFRVALRGYAEDEVDIFLDQVADTISDLNRRLDEAQGEIRELREAEDRRRRREMEMRDSPPPAPPLTPPLLGEEQPPPPAAPGPVEPPPPTEHQATEHHDLPTQVIEPEGPAPAPPGESGESADRPYPQWGDSAP